jgi:putative aminopeptidase FrvX
VDGKALLARLAAVGGTAGAEGPAAAVLREAWAPLADEVGTDPLGNVWAWRRGAGPTVVFAAHLDVIGLVVTRRLPGGFLGFAAVGGVDGRALLGQTVTVAGRRPVPAVVATAPPHLTRPEARRRIPAFDRLVLDTGLPDDELAALVRPGDRAAFAAAPVELLGERLAAPGLDNRAGVAALHEALSVLRGVALPCELVVAANVQEEVGLRGIGPLARRLRPSAAVVVDVGFAAQPGVPDHQAVPLGRGPALAVGPSLHPGVAAALREAAEALGCTLAREVAPGATGTDAWALAVAAGGVPTGLLSIPLRSMHAPWEVVDYRDVRRTGRVLAEAARRMDAAWAASLAPRLKGGEGRAGA